MSKFGNNLGIFSLTVLIGIGAYFYKNQIDIDQLGEQLAKSILKTKKTSQGIHNGSDVEHSKSSIFNPIGSYDAKQAMENRFEGIREMCFKYSDVLRPELSALKSHLPKLDDLLFKDDLVFCPVDQVGRQSFQSLFDRLGGGEVRFIHASISFGM